MNNDSGDAKKNAEIVHDISEMKEGYIYKITSLRTANVYYGSTKKCIKKRFNEHIAMYNMWVRNPKGYAYSTSFEIVQYDDAKIELVVAYIYADESELLRLEQCFIDTHRNSVNTHAPSKLIHNYHKEKRHISRPEDIRKANDISGREYERLKKLKTHTYDEKMRIERYDMKLNGVDVDNYNIEKKYKKVPFIESKIEEIIKARELNQSEYDILLRRKRRSGNDKLSMQKYQLTTMLNVSTLTPELGRAYVKKSGVIQDILNLIDNRTNDVKYDGVKPVKRRDSLLRLSTIRQIMRELNIEYLTECELGADAIDPGKFAFLDSTRMNLFTRFSNSDKIYIKIRTVCEYFGIAFAQETEQRMRKGVREFKTCGYTVKYDYHTMSIVRMIVDNSDHNVSDDIIAKLSEFDKYIDTEGNDETPSDFEYHYPRFDIRRVRFN